MRVLADGQITPDEYQELYKAVEAVLPPEARRQAIAARREVEGSEKAATSAERDNARQMSATNAFMTYQFSRLISWWLASGARTAGGDRAVRQSGDTVVLVRVRGNRFSDAAIAVMLPNGKQIGFVPDDDAQYLAPHLDEGGRYEAKITRILAAGRSPIPVVQAHLYPSGTSESGTTADRPCGGESLLAERSRLAIALVVSHGS